MYASNIHIKVTVKCINQTKKTGDIVTYFPNSSLSSFKGKPYDRVAKPHIIEGDVDEENVFSITDWFRLHYY